MKALSDELVEEQIFRSDDGETDYCRLLIIVALRVHDRSICLLSSTASPGRVTFVSERHEERQ
jgi:hypothetical protein